MHSFILQPEKAIRSVFAPFVTLYVFLLYMPTLKGSNQQEKDSFH